MFMARSATRLGARKCSPEFNGFELRGSMRQAQRTVSSSTLQGMERREDGPTVFLWPPMNTTLPNLGWD